MQSSYDIIKGPLVTEKGTRLKDTYNKVLLKVAQDANKIEIKRAVEEIFNVKVLKISTINQYGKKKRHGLKLGKRSDWKKAIVTLKQGEKLEFLERV
ncbi:MAG: 50S ribosomal protein L23 [Nitrospirota bacterium]